MRILVTGADGFVGRHLCRHLLESGDDLLKLSHPADITDAASVRNAVEAAQPEGVVHLAGFSSVQQSNREPGRAFDVNATGAVNVLAAVQQTAPDARVLLICSAEMYGAVPPGSRATEDWPLVPLNPYASSKVAAEVAGFQFHRSHGLQVLSARPFNHLGGGQRLEFAIPSFARQIVAVRRKEAPPVLRVGNLESVRDFNHVIDVVEAYRLLVTAGIPGHAYNVCSGEGRTIGSVLHRMIELSGVAVKVEIDPARLRPSELPYLVGDSRKLRRLGWNPSRTVDDALRDALAWAEQLTA